MADGIIQFTKTDSYILAPTDRVQLSLRATPPTGASLAISAYSARLGQETGFRQIGQAIIDNLANKPATPQYVIPITPGLGYAFRLAGDARLLVPGYHSMTVGLLLTGACGELIHDFGSHNVDVTHALLHGLFYVRMQ